MHQERSRSEQIALDDAWQRDMRDRILIPGFYGAYVPTVRVIFLDNGRISSVLQRQYKVDTIVQYPDGRVVFIDEKIVRWPRDRGHAYTAYCLETESCSIPGYETPGWMVNGEADILLYCYGHEDGNGLDCHWIDFQKLKAWFRPVEHTFPAFAVDKNGDTPRGRVVDFEAVAGNVPVWRRTIVEGAR